jgi:LuxR family transcriptional regulator
MWQPRDPLHLDAVNAADASESRRDARRLSALLAELGSMAPRGFSAGLHIRFASPVVYVRTYPKAWQRRYDENAYALRDPAVFWGLAVRGVTRWSEIRLPDPFDIFVQAGRYGLRFGMVASFGQNSSLSILGLARADR